MTQVSSPSPETKSASSVQRYSATSTLERLRQVGILIALVVTIAVFSSLTPLFLTTSNIVNILVQSSINAIIGIGMTLVIISGGIDLSVGALAAVVGVVTATHMLDGGSVAGAIAIGLGLGMLAGAINGTLIASLGLQPFIVTLATMSLFRGAALIYTNGDPIFNIPDAYRQIFTRQYGPIPGLVLFVVIVAFGAYMLLNFTRVGIYIKAIGGNEEAGRLAGVPVGFYKVVTYTLSGTFAALASLVLMGRLGAAEPIAGVGYELDAIAAAAVGGTSLMGGKGNIVGTILGALILGALRTGLTLLNVQAFYQLLATGAIILIAVLIDRFTRGNT